MPYYKDLSNQLHWLDDPAFERLLPEGSVEITTEQAEAIRAANITHDSPAVRRPISALQFRMALNQMGLRNDVEAAVAAGDQDLKDWYQFNTIFVRDNPHILAIEAGLHLDKTQFDALWDLGATL